MRGRRPSDRRAPTRFALLTVASVTAAAASGGFTLGELAALGAPVEPVDVIRPDGSRQECVFV